jgi:hypothetical protein
MTHHLQIEARHVGQIEIIVKDLFANVLIFGILLLKYKGDAASRKDYRQ